MKRLEGKVAIVSGAARGIGGGVARALALNGAKVVMVDILADVLEENAAAVTEKGGEVTTILADVTEEAKWKEIVDTTVEKYGTVNVLVPLAGMYGGPGNDILSLDKAVWDQVLNVNLFGQLYAMKYAIPIMKRDGGGSIMMCGSMSTVSSCALDTVYVATKNASVGIARGAAHAFGRDNIRVNAISPGIINTSMCPVSEDENDPTHKYFMEIIKLPWIGVPEDVADVAVFLASDESRYITGVNLAIDGGYSTGR